MKREYGICILPFIIGFSTFPLNTWDWLVVSPKLTFCAGLPVLTKLIRPAVSQGSDSVGNHVLQGRAETHQWESYLGCCWGSGVSRDGRIL